MNRKKKNVLLMVFKVFLKVKWKHRKLKFNTLEETAFSIKKLACFCFSNLFSCLEFFRNTALFGNEKEKTNRLTICRTIVILVVFNLVESRFPNEWLQLWKASWTCPPTQLRKVIPIKKRVAVAWWLQLVQFWRHSNRKIEKATPNTSSLSRNGWVRADTYPHLDTFNFWSS